MDNFRQVMVFPDKKELEDYALEKWRENYLRAVEGKGFFAAALSGGQTPVGFYRKLADYGGSFEWQKVHIFLVDERFVPWSDRDSNYRMIRETLIERISIPSGNIHPVPTDTPDLRIAVGEYEKDLVRFFKLKDGEFPEFDFIVLGVGTDGHTASLIADTACINEFIHPVCPVFAEKQEHDRITFTFPVINKAGFILVLVTGDEKAGIMLELIEQKNPLLPAALVKPERGTLLYLLDGAAARYISKEHSMRA